MPIKTSGSLSLSEIAAEFGDAPPHSLSEFYRGGGKVPNAAANGNIPTAGAIGFGGFFGAVNEIIQTVTSLQINLNVSDLFGASTYTTNIPKRLIINSGVQIGSYVNTTASLVIPGGLGGSLVVENYGSILGAGAEGNGANGGDAVQVGSYITFINHSSGVIYGGGGNGGRGGDGGQGGDGSYNIMQLCPPMWAVMRWCNAGEYIDSGADGIQPGGAGGAGGNGGRGQGFNIPAATAGSAGGAGQYVGNGAGNGGQGGTGGNGGGWGQAGSSGSSGANGLNGNYNAGRAPTVGPTAGGSAGRYFNGYGYVTFTNYGALAGGTA
jgi:hypothetical protein